MLDSSSKQKLYNICNKYRLALVYLFGSQALTGEKILAGKKVIPENPLTDIDVGVVTMDPLPDSSLRYKFYAALYNDLEDLFMPLRLDLVLLEENHSVFQLEAIKGICIYMINEEKKDDYEIMILRRAADFQPFLEKYFQEVLEEI